MKIVAGLCWFDEPLEFLDRLVRSLRGHVDELVAVDGAWRGYPDATPTSAREQRDVIRLAAAESDLHVRILTPNRVWESQIEKRQRLFDLAIKERHGDWVMVVDGDFIVAECDDDALRKSLTLTGLDVAMVMIRPLNQSWPYCEMPTHAAPHRMIWRGHPGLTMEHLHYGIRIGNRWLHGDTAHVNVEPALDLSRIVVFDHDNMNRPKHRNDAMRAYRQTRFEERLETWQ